MRLAERLGGISIEKLLRERTKREIQLWLAWIAKEPSDGEKIEQAIARLCAIQTSTKTKRTKPEDFRFKSNWTPKNDIKSDVNWIRASLNKK